MLKTVLKRLVPIADIIGAPIIFLAALVLRIVRRAGTHRTPVARLIFDTVGIFPIRDHYYEPMFNPSHLRHPLRIDRPLPGIDFNVSKQLETLKQFSYSDELRLLPREKPASRQGCFYFNNPSFGPGDSECLYSTVRLFSPRKIIEIGAGSSTLMFREALRANRRERPSRNCEHICIEPFPQRWLVQLEDIAVLHQPLESIDPALFSELEQNDIVFIDSSHVIRPQGDVLYEYLQILPALRSGVLVHIHDIFSPKDYLDDWILLERKLWNEQYLVEAFLTCNGSFEIIAALNFLKRHYPREISSAFPVLAECLDSAEPASLWIRKI